MNTKTGANRRDFIKSTAIGVLGLAATKSDPLFAAPAGAWPVINPDIDNTRVVCCFDTQILKSTPSGSFNNQNNAVDAQRVYADMDLMAIQLVKPKKPAATADEAWRTIFRSGKAWNSTRVAIKINGVTTLNMTRVAILKKLCDVLTGFGAQPSNIIIYDGCHNAYGADKYTPYCSVTDATKVRAAVSNGNSLLGGTVSVNLGANGSHTCTADIVNGKIDIIINAAVNKGHDRAATGNFTLTMKNHYGTFSPDHMDDGAASTAYWLALNKSAPILGGTPVRQQLCLIDSLVSNTSLTPAGAPDKRLDRIIMGTFSPVVDYLCVKKIRDAVMKATYSAPTLNALLADTGYTESQLQWDEFVPPVSRVQGYVEETATGSLEVVVANGSFRPAAVRIWLPGVIPVMEARIVDMQGKTVRVLRGISGPSGHASCVWDGRNTSGVAVRTGAYTVRVTGSGIEKTGEIVLYR